MVIDPSQLLTLAELAKRLKVSKRWIYEQVRSRKRNNNPLPCIRMRRFLRFYFPHVSDWLLQQSTHKQPGGAA
jgi:excisionase family DNA binding protein